LQFPWGDVSTAFYSTGIPNIEIYLALPTSTIAMLKASRPFGWLMGSPPVRSLLTAAVRRQPPGPDEATRKRGLSLLYGEARNAAGERVAARMTTPEGYTFTALAAVACAEKVLNGQYTPGFQTPSLAYGADLVLEIPAVTRNDA
jgi:short subunit dehydrogenase-like uncharacterized protein